MSPPPHQPRVAHGGNFLLFLIRACLFASGLYRKMARVYALKEFGINARPTTRSTSLAWFCQVFSIFLCHFVNNTPAAL